MTTKGQRGFEDLECYQLALQVLKEAYRVADRLPVEEKYNLANQMHWAATSVILNIAEGYGRFHYLDTLRFYYIARGSLNETLSAFIVCKELQYTQGEIQQQRELCHSALRSLNGYIRYVRKQQKGHKEYGDSAIRENPAQYSIATQPLLDE
ncbi:MAG: four helix bundle protein [Anaerolineales bacterium]|nr:four helix bundle protein [Anaerolineales bacterium]